MNIIPTARYLDVSIRGGVFGRTWQISAYDTALPDYIRTELGLTARSEQIKQALEREAKKMRLQPNEVKDDKTTQRLRVLRQVSGKPDDVLMRDWIGHISETEGISTQTIYRWQKEAERGKVTSDRAPIPVALSLASGPLAITVKSRTFTPAAVEYGVALLMNNPHMDIKQTYSELFIEAETQGWEIGSLQSFYRAYQYPAAPKALECNIGWGGIMTPRPPATAGYHRGAAEGDKYPQRPVQRRSVSRYQQLIAELLPGGQSAAGGGAVTHQSG